MELLIGLAGAAIGAIATLFAVWLNMIVMRRVQTEDRQERTKIEEDRSKTALTLQLFLQWDDISLLRSRNIAHGLLENNKDPYTKLFKETDPEIWVHVSKIFHFYEMLGDLIGKNLLDMSLYDALFSRVASYWIPTLIQRLDSPECKAEPSLEARLTSIRRAYTALQGQIV